MNTLGTPLGLLKEGLLSWGLAASLPYAFDKILKKNIGVYYLYLFSAVNLGASINNTVQYYYNIQV